MSLRLADQYAVIAMSATADDVAEANATGSLYTREYESGEAIAARYELGGNASKA
jgi:hypothetical protein